MKGIIKSVTDRNFGFIRASNGAEHFFHRENFNGFWDDLVADFRANGPIELTFDSIKTPKGMRAENVRRTDFPNQSVVEE